MTCLSMFRKRLHDFVSERVQAASTSLDSAIMARGYVPKIPVPKQGVIAVEHPCLVKNDEKAIEMLGGSQAISQALVDGTERALALSFSPQDPTTRTILSNPRDVDNLLLKITVPKRTGRKRKRGSDSPFVESVDDVSTIADCAHLHQSMIDNPEKYVVEAIGRVETMHVWRSMPDFVYSTQSSDFLDSVKSKILPQQLSSLKEWSLPRTYGLEDTETLPPPVWSTTSFPQTYAYRQNPSTRTGVDPSTGKHVSKLQQQPPKIYTYQAQWDAEEYPKQPMPECPPLDTQSDIFQELVSQIRSLFEKRPIWTRRAIANNLPETAPFFLIRFAVAYVAYAMRSGPWRDAYIKFGVDPRTDPQYRFYQTILIQISARDTPRGKRDFEAGKVPVARTWTRSADATSHVFTGTKPAPVDGKVWQFCDLHDPQLKALVHTPPLHLRAVCEARYFGWYANGTNAKIRVVLKAKVDALAAGLPLPEQTLERFLTLPEFLGHDERARPNEQRLDPTAGYLASGATKQELEWASVYRSMARTSLGDTPNFGGQGKGRLTKSKRSYRPSYIERAEQTEESNVDRDPEETSECLHRNRSRTNLSQLVDGDTEMQGEIGNDEDETSLVLENYAEPELGEGDESENDTGPMNAG